MTRRADTLHAIPASVARGPLGAVILLAICAAVYLPGLFTIPTIDRDEARFAQASRQMFESVALSEEQTSEAMHAGGLAVPMVQDRPRLNKPPLIYWLQAGSAALLTRGDPLDDAIWMYRIPSVLGAVLAVLVTWRIGCSMFDPRAGLLAGALLAVCPLVVWDAHQARADQVLLACTAVAMWGLWEVWKRRGREWSDRPQRRLAKLWWGVVMWLAIAAGIMTKGPITPMIVLLSALMLCVVSRRWGWLWSTQPWGVALVALAVGPWVWAVAQHVGWDAYVSEIVDETLGRSASPKEGHWGPPGYHLVLMVVLFWPGSMLTGVSFVRAWKLGVLGRMEKHAGDLDEEPVRKRDIKKHTRTWWRIWRERIPGRDGELFLVCWVVPSWIVFELVMTKLPHYTMPLYPALALISARGVLAASAGSMKVVTKRPYAIGLALWTFLMFALLMLPSIMSVWLYPIGIGGIALGVVLAWALTHTTAYLLSRARFKWAQLVSIFAAVLLAWAWLGLQFPRAERFWVTPALLESLRERDPSGERPIAAVGYHEDSLVFGTRGRVDRINPDQLRDWLAAHPDGLVAVDMTKAGEVGLEPPLEVEARGFNYSRGRWLTITIIDGEARDE